MFVLFLHDLPSASRWLGATARTSILLSVTLNAPVENVIILVTFTNKKITEKFAEVRIIRLVVETKSASIVQEDAELIGEATTEEVSWSSHLLFHYTVIFLLLGCGLETLPRKSTAEEVHENVSKRFEVVATSLFYTKMSVDGSITGGTREILVLSVRNMEMSPIITVFLGQTIVNHIDLVATLSNAHQKVVWFDVTVDKVARVNVFNARNLKETK